MTVCAHCGDVLSPRPGRPGRPKRYCTAACRIRARVEKDRIANAAARAKWPPLTCPRCGVTFTRTEPRQAFCRERCRLDAHNARQRATRSPPIYRTCPVCAARFRANSSSMTYCTMACTRLAASRRAQARWRARPPRGSRPPATCRQCAGAFTPPRRGVVYCGHDCRERWWMDRRKRGTRRPIERVCPVCENRFTVRGSTQRYCESYCLNAARLEQAYRVRRAQRRVYADIECRECAQPFTPVRPHHAFCQPRCCSRWHEARRPSKYTPEQWAVMNAAREATQRERTRLSWIDRRWEEAHDSRPPAVLRPLPQDGPPRRVRHTVTPTLMLARWQT